MIRLWAQILSETPDSRLLFHFMTGGQSEIGQDFRGPIERYFRQLRIDGERITWVGVKPLAKHLEIIQEADIALDTHPCTGMATTLECLWMGVPVVTLRGETRISRVSSWLLGKLGLNDWAADTAEEYCGIAVRHARNPSAVEELRGLLRPRMEHSSLMDEVGYTRGIESAYRECWRRWCARVSEESS